MKQNLHTSPDLFEPDTVTNVFNPNSSEFLGQVKVTGQCVTAQSARDNTTNTLDNLSNGLQTLFFIKRKRVRKRKNDWDERMKLYYKNIKKFYK